MMNTKGKEKIAVSNAAGRLSQWLYTREPYTRARSKVNYVYTRYLRKDTKPRADILFIKHKGVMRRYTKPARNSRRAHHGTVSGSSHVRCDRTDRAGSASEAVCRVDDAAVAAE